MDHATESHGKEKRKAGLLLHGIDSKGERAWLLPTIEGRFAVEGEYLVPPKGGVDDHKTPPETELEAAIRELGEETGIWLYDRNNPDRCQLTDEQMSHLEQGHDLHDIELKKYPGVTLTHFRAKPHRSHYISRGGIHRPLAMFEAEIEGIDQFKPHLKNGEGKTTHQILIEHPEIPRFRHFLGYLIDGHLPGSDQPLVDATWFKGLLKEYQPELLAPQKYRGRELRPLWKAFVSNLERDHPGEYRKLEPAFEAIKDYAKEQGWTKGDTDALKLDTKDAPLWWCAEGAKVLPEREALAKMFRDMSENEDYNKAIGGIFDLLTGLNPVERVLMSQLGGLVPFAAAQNIQEALREAVRKNGGKPLNWTRDPQTRVALPIAEIEQGLMEAQTRAQQNLWPSR